MEKVIEITARREGFRRCGVAHSATTKEWPADAFTPEQLAVLKADPMLIVVERDKASGQNDAARGDELVAQLDAERRRQLLRFIGERSGQRRFFLSVRSDGRTQLVGRHLF